MKKGAAEGYAFITEWVVGREMRDREVFCETEVVGCASGVDWFLNGVFMDRG